MTKPNNFSTVELFNFKTSVNQKLAKELSLTKNECGNKRIRKRIELRLIIIKWENKARTKCKK